MKFLDGGKNQSTQRKPMAFDLELTDNFITLVSALFGDERYRDPEITEINNAAEYLGF